jgi:hypothetical protein
MLLDFAEPESIVIEQAQKCRRRITNYRKQLAQTATELSLNGKQQESKAVDDYSRALRHIDASLGTLIASGNFGDELMICCWFASTLLQPVEIKQNTLAELPIYAMRTIERNFSMFPNVSNRKH